MFLNEQSVTSQVIAWLRLISCCIYEHEEAMTLNITE